MPANSRVRFPWIAQCKFHSTLHRQNDFIQLLSLVLNESSEIELGTARRLPRGATAAARRNLVLFRYNGSCVTQYTHCAVQYSRVPSPSLLMNLKELQFQHFLNANAFCSQEQHFFCSILYSPTKKTTVSIAPPHDANKSKNSLPLGTPWVQ